MERILALDIGGTAVKYGIFQGDNIKNGQFAVTDEEGKENLPEKICEFISQNPVDKIAIAVPDPFDFETGTSYMEHKLPSLKGISLRKEIMKYTPDTEVLFIHDATAFCLGAMVEFPDLLDKRFGCAMLGTGLGYNSADKGKVLVNEKETPLTEMWNKPYLDGICENYVSATAIINMARAKGYDCPNAKFVSDRARQGDEECKNILYQVGEHLAKIMAIARDIDSFEELVIGGQVVLSWDLMKEGFESIMKLPYRIVKDPTACALYGLYRCAAEGKENIYK